MKADIFLKGNPHSNIFNICAAVEVRTVGIPFQENKQTYMRYLSTKK